MRKRFFLLGALVLLIFLIFLLFFFDLPAIVILVLGLTAGTMFGLGLKQGHEIKFADAESSESSSSTDESFALAKLFEATMSGMREGLLVVDQEMRVVASNVAARRLFNASPDRLESQRLTQLTRNPDIYSAFLDGLKGQERSGVKIETFGSGRRVFDLRVVPLKGDGTEPEGAIGVFFDVTQLERLERVRQEFLSNVSHELRTPLTAILTFVETLETDSADEEDRNRFLSIIRKNASRMQNLIDDILELSAIEAGTVNVQAKEIDLASLVDDVLMSLEGSASTRGVDLANELEVGTMVLADPVRMEQMLTNLIENAIKFNREGGRVTVRYEENPNRSRILIEDTGEGIPAQHLERLFERFYRIDRARSRDMGGTGLGLAIVKHLARAHGGEVAVESKLGEGSVFAIELPKPQQESNLFGGG